MDKPVRSLTYFDLSLSIDTKGQEVWLQITQVHDIGLLDKQPVQKIIRLSPEKQLELYELLVSRFEKE